MVAANGIVPVVPPKEGFEPFDQIRADIAAKMLSAGWTEARFRVVVVEPMLEAWLWMDNDNVAHAFGVKAYSALRAKLIQEHLWEAGQPKPKPAELKRACSRACDLGGTLLSCSGIYEMAFRNVDGILGHVALTWRGV